MVKDEKKGMTVIASIEIQEDLKLKMLQEVVLPMDHCGSEPRVKRD